MQTGINVRQAEILVRVFSQVELVNAEVEKVRTELKTEIQSVRLELCRVERALEYKTPLYENESEYDLDSHCTWIVFIATCTICSLCVFFIFLIFSI